MVLTLERAGFMRRQPGVARTSKCSLIRKACRFYAEPLPTSQNLCVEVLELRPLFAADRNATGRCEVQAITPGDRLAVVFVA